MKYIERLTEKQKEMMPVWRDKWIAKGLQTGETDWGTFEKYIPICYQKAKIRYPNNIIKVSSPLVGGLAAMVANEILKKNNYAPSVDDVGGVAGRGVVAAVDGDVDEKRAPNVLDEFGNTGSAGSLIAFHKFNHLERGQKGLICSFGGGYSICSIIIEKE